MFGLWSSVSSRGHKIVMFYAKIHRSGSITVLGICDEEILGKELHEGELTIFIDPKFYGGERIGEEKALELVKEASSVNAFGNKIVKLLMDKKIIKNARSIGGQLHAQLYRI